LKNEMLASLFSGSLIWFRGSNTIHKTKSKAENSTLLLNGTKDLQVSVGEAEQKKSKPDAEL
jgi:hypothetical protein